MRRRALTDLRPIPSVGTSIAGGPSGVDHRSAAGRRVEFPRSGIGCVETRIDLHGGRSVLCVKRGFYVMRSALFCASHDRHDPALLKWRNWKESV